jgi:hypothetical protein
MAKAKYHQDAKAHRDEIHGISAAAIGGALQSDENPPPIASPAQSAQPARVEHTEHLSGHADDAIRDADVRMAQIEVHEDEEDEDQEWRRAGGGDGDGGDATATEERRT